MHAPWCQLAVGFYCGRSLSSQLERTPTGFSGTQEVRKRGGLTQSWYSMRLRRAPRPGPASAAVPVPLQGTLPALPVNGSLPGLVHPSNLKAGLSEVMVPVTVVTGYLGGRSESTASSPEGSEEGPKFNLGFPRRGPRRDDGRIILVATSVWAT